MKNLFRLLMLFTGTLALAACTGGVGTMGGPAQPTYADYDGVLIEPIVSHYASPGTGKIANTLAYEYRDGLRAAFRKRLPLVGHAGPRTLHVRAVVRDGIEGGTPLRHAHPSRELKGNVGSATGVLRQTRLSAAIYEPSGRRIALLPDQHVSSIPGLDAASNWLELRMFCDDVAEKIAGRLPMGAWQQASH